MGNSEHSNRVVVAIGRILSTNTRFPGSIKQFSSSVAGRSKGLAGEGTTGRSARSSGTGLSASLTRVSKAGGACKGDELIRDCVRPCLSAGIGDALVPACLCVGGGGTICSLLLSLSVTGDAG